MTPGSFFSLAAVQKQVLKASMMPANSRDSGGRLDLSHYLLKLLSPQTPIWSVVVCLLHSFLQGSLRRQWLFGHICASLGDAPGGSVSKESAASELDSGDMNVIPGSGRSLGGGHGNPPQYSCMENPMDGGAWWAIVYRVAKNWIWLKWLSMHTRASLGQMRSILHLLG